VSDCLTKTEHLKGVLSGVLCASALAFCSQTQAFEVGFEGILQLEASDNVEGDNAPNEVDGIIQSAVLGVYGEHRSKVVRAAFSGELDTRKTSTTDNSDVNSISRFIGAAEFKLTPRSWVWYVGDILGGVRSDNEIQVIDDIQIERRNVFVTGPSFQYEQQGISRTSARAWFVNQTQDNESLENLYLANFSHERDLTPGSFYGFRLGNIFTDKPNDDDSDLEDPDFEEDFNRATFGVFYNRLIGFLTLFGEVGLTRYDADSESLDGLNALLRATRELGPQTTFSLFFQRDLSDQSLSAVESLVQSGENAIGVAPNSAGFFTESRVGAEYSFKGPDTAVDLVAGVAQLDYPLLSGDNLSVINFGDEDRVQAFASALWSQRLGTQLRSELGLSYETQEYDNRVDNLDSVLLKAQLIYELSLSFDLQVGITHETGLGLRTRFAGDIPEPEEIDITQNRLLLGLRWAPPSRASQELTFELKSLLQ